MSITVMSKEKAKINQEIWKKWGPYLSNRQWATVREDYSDDSNTWQYMSYEDSRSRAYRWGEDGIAGISDNEQLICFSVGLWNKKDPHIKERLFGLTNRQGNHGEDVKELYYNLDNTPSHSYMKLLYKYPQAEFPYKELLEENRLRSRLDPEYELIDTGIFNEKKYFDIAIEYAKQDPEDILIRITVTNRGGSAASLHILPTIWFRNTWSWGDDPYKPQLNSGRKQEITIHHRQFAELCLYSEEASSALFCENETNRTIFFGERKKDSYKDGINDFIVKGDQKALRKKRTGTKASFNYDVFLEPYSSKTFCLRLGPAGISDPFEKFHEIFEIQRRDAEFFFDQVFENKLNAEEKNICRQALSGMLWNKQFYYYDVDRWLNGDPGLPASPARKKGRNHRWGHLHNYDIISMPDKWEYPWYAAWDLAFHAIPLAMVDIRFAREQLILLTRERSMHPNGQLPAYEWDFSDVNPPVHAWAAWKVYTMDKTGGAPGDLKFLESIFHKLLINFTWWVNRKDNNGDNIFQGGFLGLDNIGVFDRNAKLPGGGYMEQADGTSWMALYSLNMLRISMELARYNPVYEDMATKFFEHFLYIAGAMGSMGSNHLGLWDEDDGFYYDQVRLNEFDTIQLKVRSMVGLIPLFAVEILEDSLIEALPDFKGRMQWFLTNRPDLADMVSRWQETNKHKRHMLSLLRKKELKRILEKMLDETEFLSDYGIRSLSKYHQENPFNVSIGADNFSIRYTPGESDNDMFGGNSNWRGPVWFPLNYMVVESLKKFHAYYEDDFKIECPTGSGIQMNLQEVAEEIALRLSKLFLLDSNRNRPVSGEAELLQYDPNFRDHFQFFEYFHGDTGRGMGAAQQTGWTGLIADLLLSSSGKKSG